MCPFPSPVGPLPRVERGPAGERRAILADAVGDRPIDHLFLRREVALARDEVADRARIALRADAGGDVDDHEAAQTRAEHGSRDRCDEPAERVPDQHEGFGRELFECGEHVCRQQVGAIVRVFAPVAAAVPRQVERERRGVEGKHDRVEAVRIEAHAVQKHVLRRNGVGVGVACLRR